MSDDSGRKTDACQTARILSAKLSDFNCRLAFYADPVSQGMHLNLGGLSGRIERGRFFVAIHAENRFSDAKTFGIGIQYPDPIA